jgi:hypothetical protein
MQAFPFFASAHKPFMAQTTEERLNRNGTPANFRDQRSRENIRPTYARADHPHRSQIEPIVAWRGSCTVTRIISPSSYEMEEECSGRKFQRTIINIRPFRASKNPPPPHHDLIAVAALHPETVIAVRDFETDYQRVNTLR